MHFSIDFSVSFESDAFGSNRGQGIPNGTYMRPIENADGTHVSLLTNAFRLSSDAITRNKTLLRRKYKVLEERGNSIFTPKFMAVPDRVIPKT